MIYFYIQPVWSEQLMDQLFQISFLQEKSADRYSCYLSCSKLISSVNQLSPQSIPLSFQHTADTRNRNVYLKILAELISVFYSTNIKQTASNMNDCAHTHYPLFDLLLQSSGFCGSRIMSIEAAGRVSGHEL